MGLRVIFFNRSFYPDITATSQLLFELCEDLVKDYGWQVSLIVSRPLLMRDDDCPPDNFGMKMIKREYVKKIEILRVRNTAFSQRFFMGRLFNYLTYFFLSFIASFKLEGPDLVIALTDPPIIGLVGLWVSRRFNIPLVVSVRDIFPEVAKSLGGRQNKTMNFLLDWINRFCLKRAAHIVALGGLMRRRLIEEKGINPDKISIITDWADCAKIFPVSKRNPFSLTHNLADFFVVMYSGNLGALSGAEDLIESANLLKDYKDILFVFIGEGIIKDKLIRFSRKYKLKNIRFFSYQPRDSLSYSFSSADIFVISLKKGMAGYSVPSKIYPILASGRPYIAAVDEESEIAKITQEFNCGLIAKAQEPLELTKKILFLRDNQELKTEMGRNARKAALFFDRSRGTKAYAELFKRLLSDKKKF